MKKFKYVSLLMPLLLVACFHPPTPNVEEAIQNADPNTILSLSNDITNDYFKTALPFLPSPARGLIFSHIRNRADIIQVERSLMRIATDYFDPEFHYIREGQHLTRDFASSLLRHQNPEPTNTEIESRRGLNAAIGTPISFGDATFSNHIDDDIRYLIRPFAYLVEQNFVTISDNNQFELEGVAIGIALNPFYFETNTATGFEHLHQMPDADILEIGKEIAANLLPQLRESEETGGAGLEEVPILIGLYILRSDQAVIPGHFASVTFVEEGRSSIRDWVTVHERHFILPDPAINEINVHDVDINEQFNSFRETITNYFPHQNGIVGRVHFVDNNVYRVSITVNISFLGATEKMSFFQLMEEYVMNFSREYDIRIIVRDLETQLGAINRPPGGEPAIHLLDW